MTIRDIIITILACALLAALACWKIDRSNYERGLYLQAEVDCGCNCNCDCDKTIEVESGYTSVINPIADPGEIRKIINEAEE
jgi:hypothetical protein